MLVLSAVPLLNIEILTKTFSFILLATSCKNLVWVYFTIHLLLKLGDLDIFSFWLPMVIALRRIQTRKLLYGIRWDNLLYMIFNPFYTVIV